MPANSRKERMTLATYSRTPLWFFATILIASATAGSEPRPPISVRQALEQEQESRARGLAPSPIRVAGILTSPFNAFGLDENQRPAAVSFVQDSSAAIGLEILQSDLAGRQFKPGDMVEIDGKIEHNGYGKILKVDRLQQVGAARLPAPRAATAAGVCSGRFTNEIVTLSGNLQPIRSLSEIVFQDPTGTLNIFVPAVQAPQQLIGRLSAGGQATITGFAIPPDPGTSAPCFVGVRTAADIQFAPVPPYVAIAAVSGGLLIGACWLILVLRQRHSERRARELAQLSDLMTQARDAALEASRAKSEFLANMSHELRT